MRTLLRIDSSLRTTGSYSRKLGDFFIGEWKKKNPNNKIKHRDFSKSPITHLDQETLNGFYGASNPTDLLKLSDEFIAELVDVDEVLITVPMYNFGIPSSLKAYFDLVVRTGKTVKYENETIGLLQNKEVYIISSMGDEKTHDKSLVEIHLQCILKYIGIAKVHCFVLDHTSNRSLVTEKLVTQKKEIINLLNQ